MTKDSETQKYDVVVVGAGLSGLQAAQLVQAAGFKVCVLEAIDRVGGKTLTAKSCEKGFNDLGASWINDTNQSEMFKLYQKYGLETEIQRDCGDTLIQSVDGNTVKVPYGQLPVCFAFFSPNKRKYRVLLFCSRGTPMFYWACCRCFETNAL